MEWLNRLTYNKNLRTSFAIYMLAFLISGLILTKTLGILTANYIQYVQSLYFIEEVIKEGNEYVTHFKLNQKGPTEFQKSSVTILLVYNEFSLTINLLIFAISGFSLYFKHKIKKPIDELKDLEIILEEDCFLESEDEILGIIHNYNHMIDKVKIEKKKMWTEVEEMEQMMSAFEHDIRTPITIIRGHNDMILKYYLEGKMDDKKLEKILLSTKVQISRLDEYIKRMSNLKNIKELELNIKSTETKILLNNMQNIGKVLSKETQFKINNDLQSDYLYLDENIILEVYENIIINGLRYAETKIEVNIYEDDTYFIINVQDDGKGFTKDALKYGTVAFFSENKSNGNNIGLGLNISKELCEKHTGMINLSNNSIGGLVEIKIKKFNSNIVDKK